MKPSRLLFYFRKTPTETQHVEHCAQLYRMLPRTTQADVIRRDIKKMQRPKENEGKMKRAGRKRNGSGVPICKGQALYLSGHEFQSKESRSSYRRKSIAIANTDTGLHGKAQLRGPRQPRWSTRRQPVKNRLPRKQSERKKIKKI